MNKYKEYLHLLDLFTDHMVCIMNVKEEFLRKSTENAIAYYVKENIKYGKV